MFSKTFVLMLQAGRLIGVRGAVMSSIKHESGAVQFRVERDVHVSA